MAGTSSRGKFPIDPPVVDDPVQVAEDLELLESEEVPSVDEILNRPGRPMTGFGSPGGEDQLNNAP